MPYHYKTLGRKMSTYCPEVQLFEILFEYCNNNLNINEALIPINICKILR